MKSTETGRQTQAYRSYLIRHNPFNGLCWVEKDGTRICYAQNTVDAQVLIDRLLADGPDDFE